MLRTVEVCGSASGRVSWDGRSVGCAPTDAPSFCGDVEPDEYRIVARLYDAKKQSLVATRGSTSKAKVIAEGSSTPFTITGERDLSPLRSRMQGSVTRHIAGHMGAGHFAGTQMDRYAKMQCEVTGPDATGRYCGTFDLKRPLAGSVHACGKLGATDFAIEGDVREVEGMVAFREAARKAHALADAPYRARVGGDTYLSTDIANWSYREDGGYWAFVVYEVQAGGTGPDSSRFADNVVVRVADDGAACVVTTVACKAPLGVDLFTSPIACP